MAGALSKAWRTHKNSKTKSVLRNLDEPLMLLLAKFHSVSVMLHRLSPTKCCKIFGVAAEQQGRQLCRRGGEETRRSGHRKLGRVCLAVSSIQGQFEDVT